MIKENEELNTPAPITQQEWVLEMRKMSLVPKLSRCRNRRSTEHCMQGHIRFRIEVVAWQLPFVSRQVKTHSEAREQLINGVLSGEADVEFKVEDQMLLQAVYGDTYESLSAVDGHRLRQSSDLVQRLECEVVRS